MRPHAPVVNERGLSRDSYVIRIASLISCCHVKVRRALYRDSFSDARSVSGLSLPLDCPSLGYMEPPLHWTTER